MRRIVTLALGGLATGVFGFLAGLHLTFPDDAALRWLGYQVQDATRSEWGIQADDLDLYLLSGASLDNATLMQIKKPRFRRGQEEQPAEVSPFLHMETLRARLELLPLIRRGIMVAYSADLYGGNLSGEAGEVSGVRRLVAEGSEIDLSKIAFAGEDWTLDLGGLLSVDADVSLDTEAIKKSEGFARLRIDKLVLQGGEFSGFKLEPMTFTESVLEFEIENGVAKVTKGHFASDLLEATVSGEITLNKDLRRCRLRLNFVLTLSDTLDKLARFAPTMSDARAEDGTYHFIMAGSPGLARPRADRMGARGGPGSEEGDGPGIMRPPMLGGPDGPGDVEGMDGPSGGDDEASAEERRQRRLERIKKARERRRQRMDEQGGTMPEGDGPMDPPFPPRIRPGGENGPIGEPFDPEEDGPIDEPMGPPDEDMPEEPFDPNNEQ